MVKSIYATCQKSTMMWTGPVWFQSWWFFCYIRFFVRKIYSWIKTHKRKWNCSWNLFGGNKRWEKQKYKSKQYSNFFPNADHKTSTISILVMIEDFICWKFYSAKIKTSDKFLTCLIKYLIMKNVEESIWRIATLDYYDE